ncbi:MAG: sporulation initiation factor Spo0A C-terminal domain-containing protein [Ruminococcus sp.]|nr:sporulation initiation factor Spo0A C-terminal domain-containing protein [Ruminococcus sp.]
MDIKTEKKIVRLIIDLGISTSVKGYIYIIEAIKICKDLKISNLYLSKDLYPKIAEKYGTSSASVERAIRHAISTGWSHHNSARSAEVFGNIICNDKDTPSNAIFISAVSEWVRLNLPYDQ